MRSHNKLSPAGTFKEAEEERRDRRKERLGEAARIILGILLIGAVVVTVATLPGLVRVFPRPKRRRRLYPWEIRKARLRLQNERLIQVLKQQNSPIQLTRDGREVAKRLEEEKRRKEEFNTLALPGYRPWDGWWRIVTFDIPDRRKVVREALRAKLKLLGFYPLQKSVFVHPAPCEKEVAFLVEFFTAQPYIHVIRAKHIDPEEHVREYFEL